MINVTTERKRSVEILQALRGEEMVLGRNHKKGTTTSWS